MINNHSFRYRSIMFFIYHTMCLMHLSINSTTSIISVSSLFLSRVNTYLVKYFKIFFIYKHEFTILDINFIMIALINCVVFNNTLLDIRLLCKCNGFYFGRKLSLYIDLSMLMCNEYIEILWSRFRCSF